VSEYQHYEFRAIDRPLDERVLRTLRELSSRAEITPTSFVNTYNWDDFKGDPDAVMENCFDAFVYLANWGTRRFALRLPRKQFARQFLASYCGGESFQIRKAGESIVIGFCAQEDGGGEGWEEGEGWMASLVPLRTDLLRGDYRCLYLGWLRCAQNEELDKDEFEPPVPPGLKDLSGTLEAFVEFMDIDTVLLDVAASESARPQAPPTCGELAAWIRALPEKHKETLLVMAALDAGAQTGAEILRQYDLSRKNSPPAGQPKQRTVGELLAASKAEQARLAERQAAERVRQEREEAEARMKARAQYLDQLAGREQATWRKVEMLIETKQPNKYEEAVNLLVDLRDLALRRKQEAAFQPALSKLRDAHAAKPSLLRRLRDVDL
jgi:hypothetical protein